MNAHIRHSFITITATLLLLAVTSQAAAPQLINYQGRLLNSLGEPENGVFDLTTSIYSAPSGGTALWTETQSVTVSNGLFKILLGTNTALTESVFAGDVCWLGVTVGTDPELPNRSRLVTVPWSFTANTADSTDAITDGGVDLADIGQNGATLNQIMKWDGAAWTVANDETSGGGTGDIDGVTAGTGLSGGGVSGTVTLNIANGGVGAAQLAGDAVTSAKILNGTIQFGDIGANSATSGQVMKWNGSAWAAANDETGGGGDDGDWTLTGNVLFTAGRWGIARFGNTLFGINDSTHVNLGRNSVTGSGGYDYSSCTVGGGASNQANDSYATVGGGYLNKAKSANSTVGGGQLNTASNNGATVGGGHSNLASGNSSTVCGGNNGTASGSYSTVAGGRLNTAQGAYSLAAGRRANALHDGAFVWGDNSTTSDFSSTGINQFLIRARGGVGINTNAPVTGLTLGDGSIWVTGTETGLLSANAGRGIRIFNTRSDTSLSQIFAYDYGQGLPQNILLQAPGGNLGIGSFSSSSKLTVEGAVRTLNAAGGTKCKLDSTSVGSGYIATYGPLGNPTVELKSVSGNADNGHVLVRNTAGDRYVSVFVSSASGAGVVFGDKLALLDYGYSDDGVILGDSAINHQEILDEPGIASQESNPSTVLSATMADIETVTITIPAPGYIMVTGRCYLRIQAATTANYMYTQIDETAGGTAVAPYITKCGMATYPSTSTYYFNSVATRTYFKSAAGAYTFRLEGKKLNSTHVAHAYSAQVTAVYYPTAYGATMASVPPSTEGAQPTLVMAEEDPSVTKTVYRMDLRELELKAAKKRAELMQIERDILKAEAQQTTESKSQ